MQKVYALDTTISTGINGSALSTDRPGGEARGFFTFYERNITLLEAGRVTAGVFSKIFHTMPFRRCGRLSVGLGKNRLPQQLLIVVSTVDSASDEMAEIFARYQACTYRYYCT